MARSSDGRERRFFEGYGPDAPPEEYNYDHFAAPSFDGDVPRHVRAGAPAADGTLYTVDGEEVRLSELWPEKPIVVEFGSITCPIFVGAIDPMNEVAARFADDVDFYVTYVREAHPGEHYGPHRSLDEKLSNAREAYEAEDVDPDVRTVLVDGHGGTLHRQYDALPNSVYLIGTDGVVAFRADWLDADDLETAIRELLDADGSGEAAAGDDVEMNLPGMKPGVFLRVIPRAGRTAFVDLVKALPAIVRLRVVAKTRWLRE